MSDKKDQLKGAKAATLKIASDLLAGRPFPLAGLPPGVRIETNVNAVARFPLALAVPSAILLAVGVLAGFKGYRGVGVTLGVLGAAGIGASAAAPELHAAINKARSAPA